MWARVLGEREKEKEVGGGFWSELRPGIKERQPETGQWIQGFRESQEVSLGRET